MAEKYITESRNAIRKLKSMGITNVTAISVGKLYTPEFKRIEIVNPKRITPQNANNHVVCLSGVFSCTPVVITDSIFKIEKYLMTENTDFSVLARLLYFDNGKLPDDLETISDCIQFVTSPIVWTPVQSDRMPELANTYLGKILVGYLGQTEMCLSAFNEIQKCIKENGKQYTNNILLNSITVVQSVLNHSEERSVSKCFFG